MKRCLVISDSFKGTLSSPAICRIARDLAVPGWQVDALPVADGGEGTVDCFLDACGGQRVTAVVSDPFGTDAESFYGLLPDGTAVVECAAAAGLPLAEGRLDPERTTTYGVGQLMAAALDNGAKRLILGLGGSCTNDGGCGAAAALGVRFFDRQGRSFVPTGITLADIADIDLSRRHPALDDVPLTVMCDIDNQRCTPCAEAARGSAAGQLIHGDTQPLPQNGGKMPQSLVQPLHAGCICALLGRKDVCRAQRTVPLLGGTLRSGIETVLDTVDFDRRAAGYDLIVTGEGRLDSQSLGGKAVSGVAGRCRALGVPAAALVGALALEPDDLAALGLCSARSINPAGVTLQDAKAHAAAYYRDALVKLLEEMS